MLAVVAAFALATDPVPAASAPALSAAQAGTLRCGVAFAIGAKLQAEKSPVAIGWPPLALRGREFFVRAMAQVMDETGASRDALTAVAMANVPALRDPAVLDRAVTGCLPLLKAAGV